MDIKTYEDMTNYVLDTLVVQATGVTYGEMNEQTDEQVEEQYASFCANFKCACGVANEWLSPEGLIDHWELNPDCYMRTRYGK